MCTGESAGSLYRERSGKTGSIREDAGSEDRVKRERAEAPRQRPSFLGYEYFFLHSFFFPSFL